MNSEEERIRQRISERETALKTKVNLLKYRLERVKHMTDVKAAVGERPALMVAGSVLTGFLLKKLAARRHAGNGAYRGTRRSIEQDWRYAEARPRASRKLKDEFIAVISVVAGRIVMNVLSELARRAIPGKLDVHRADKDFRHQNSRAS
jgi:hypothetical protein